MADSVIDRLLELLGYDRSPGYIRAEKFELLKKHRFHLRQAAERMNVVGAFGLGTPGARFTPVVLVAYAGGFDEAKNIHKLAWSQGLTPFIAIVVSEGVYVCNAFAFKTAGWGRDTFIPNESLKLDTQLRDLGALSRLSAEQLRTSLGWRDGLASIEDRVDEALLKSLEAAGSALTKESQGFTRLRPAQANGLIGRLLYLHFLISRDILETSWLQRIGISVDNSSRGATWEPEWLWTVFDKLDELLNGSVFPIAPQERDGITAKHIEFVRGVIGYHDTVHSDGTDLGFFRVDLSVIRTETLSAIYEQFLRRSSGDSGSDGAFYTPPFLVDYVLDELEEHVLLSPNTKILDGSAGSGVFLVSSYRRLLERALPGHQKFLSHETLLRIMRDQIFAIERHQDACHIAAFSLYLTMLDYMDPNEVRALVGSEGEKRLFPKMVFPNGENILQRDLFERSKLPMSFPRRFDVVVGNPPWGALSDYRDPENALHFSNRIKKTHHSGDDQIADLFFWRLTRWFLKRDGIAGLLMPAKSFINQRSEEFVASVARKMNVLTVANLSHLRRRLFRNAIHPAVVIYVSASAKYRLRGTRVYSPNLACQPVGRDRWLWTLISDISSVEVIADTPSKNPDRFIHDAFVRHPIDRRIATYIEDLINTKKLPSIRSLERFGLIWKSGDQQRRTGIPSRFHLATSLSSESGIHRHLALGPNGGWIAAQRDNSESSAIVPLPASLLNEAKASFGQFFKGDMLAVPRSLETAYRVMVPAAFNSSFNMFAVNDSRSRSLLDALSVYFQSRAFKYFAILNSRRMMIDRWAVELESMLDLPFPFKSPDDELLAKYVGGDPEEQQHILRSEIRMPDEYWEVIDEFLIERQPFSNGNVPPHALVAPTAADIAIYTRMLTERLASLLGSNRVIPAAHTIAGRGLIAIQLRTEWSKNDDAALGRATRSYESAGADVFTCSSFVHHDREADQLFVFKPGQRLYWTRERAYADAETIDAALLGLMHAA
jgi:hypothetical protein